VWDIRAVVTDLDGTVLDEERRVSPATVRAAADLTTRGIPLIVATDRSPAWVGTLAQLLESVNVAVCCGGAIGWCPATAEILWRDVIPADTVDRIARFIAEDLPETGIAAYDGERWRLTETFATHGPKRAGPCEVVSTERVAEHPACALSLWHPTERRDAAMHALSACVQLPATISQRPATGVTDIGPPGTDKASGVRRALTEIRVAPAHAIAFGDMPNDLPMFALCGYSVAVANAHPDVIAAATSVAECVHDDGFARTLAKLQLVRAYSEPPCVSRRR
jgi:Cof subfamily protein (haloacid dehalogenase superfamily)